MIYFHHLKHYVLAHSKNLETSPHSLNLSQVSRQKFKSSITSSISSTYSGILSNKIHYSVALKHFINPIVL